MIRLICGITPELRTLRTNTSPYAPSETTPSWIRAPPESLIPITGQPILAARSMILHIFSAITSPSEPPNTVKSCENTHTRRPSVVPWPMYVSSSWKEPGSSSFSTRSRAVYLPFACCFSTAASDPWWTAAWRSSSSCASFSSYVSGLFWRMAGGRLPARDDRLDGDSGGSRTLLGRLVGEQHLGDVGLAHLPALPEHPDLLLELLVGAAQHLLGVRAPDLARLL